MGMFVKAVKGNLMKTTISPRLEVPTRIEFHFSGEVQRRLEAVIDQWILPAPYANPAILEMFRDRNRKPYREMVPWAGEFAGKYLTHCVQIYRLVRSEKLKSHLEWFVKELVSLQAKDGYLGPWPTEHELTGEAINCGDPTWDAWGHYHAMLGLLLWYRETGDQKSLECACRIGDLLCRKFLNTGERLVKTGSEEMNLAPIHSLCLLYQETGEQRYLDMAREIEKDFEVPPAGDYIREALAGKEFFQTPKPRWESLHPILGIAELYYSTGDEKYRQAFENLWWSIVQYDRHNTGGFSSGEQATGDPYHVGPIETCCTIAWMAMSVEMLRLTGSSIVADELELSFLNSGVGMMSPSGRWVTYNTPMEGQRTASEHTIVFQARPGQPELNCCSVNGPRAFGFLSDWALMIHENELFLNYYGPGSIKATMSSGVAVTLTQETDYPRNNIVELNVQVEEPGTFALALRIPSWSAKTRVWVNGEAISSVASGEYLMLNRTWSSNDRIKIEFDFRPHFWINEKKYQSFDWEAKWQVFGPVSNSDTLPHHPGRGLETLPGDGLTSMPTSLMIDGVSLMPQTVISEKGIINFRQLFGRLCGVPIAYCFLEYESECDEVIPVIFSADWWTCWFVNGNKVFDNHTTGGNGGAWVDRVNKVDLPLRKGKNLIAVRVTSGSGGWSLNVGCGETSTQIAQRVDQSGVYYPSIYRGPILLTYDPRFNDREDAMDIPTLNAGELKETQVESESWLKPWLLLEFEGIDGQIVRLCDYGSAGAAGDVYHTWLPVKFPVKPQAVFSKQNPLRSFRL
jgi:DUF1680 family protein